MTTGRAAVVPLAAPEHVRRLLATVMDPEIPVLSVVDLGVIRFVEVSDSRVRVGLTPTYSGCPATRVIAESIEAALRADGFAAVEIVPVLSPAWSADHISAEGRARLEAYGIAPPNPGQVRDGSFGAPRRCPRCHSTDTECVSPFGSTPCKALYRCRACREPFDYFKCL